MDDSGDHGTAVFDRSLHPTHELRPSAEEFNPSTGGIFILVLV